MILSDEGRVVAESFTLFLARALASDGEHFWLRTRGAKPKEKTSKKGDTKAKGFGPADFVDPDGELLAWVEQERGRPVIRWELTITFAELQRGATQIVPQLVLELRDERLRDWRELRRLEAPSKKAKAVFHWATFTKSSGSSKRLKPRNVRLDIVGRRGTRLSVRYAIELQPPGSPSLTLEGDVAVDFNAFCVTADVLGDEPSVEAAAKMLRAVAAPSSFGKLALTRLGEVEAKPRG